MSITARWARAVSLSIAVLVLAYGMQALAGKPVKKPGGGDTGPSYAIVQLDDANGAFTGGVARDINGQRQIVGQVDDPLGGVMAVCWTITGTGDDAQSELHLLTSGIVANGINELGEMVALASTVTRSWGVIGRTKMPIRSVLPPLAGYDESGRWSDQRRRRHLRRVRPLDAKAGRKWRSGAR